MRFVEQPIAPNPVIEFYMQGVDRTLYRANLQRTHEERILQLQQLVEFAEAMREAGRRARGEVK